MCRTNCCINSLKILILIFVYIEIVFAVLFMDDDDRPSDTRAVTSFMIIWVLIILIYICLGYGVYMENVKCVVCSGVLNIFAIVVYVFAIIHLNGLLGIAAISINIVSTCVWVIFLLLIVNKESQVDGIVHSTAPAHLQINSVLEYS